MLSPAALPVPASSYHVTVRPVKRMSTTMVIVQEAEGQLLEWTDLVVGFMPNSSSSLVASCKSAVSIPR
jgi:hypothetical protein